MTRTHLLYGLLVVGGLCLILFVWLHGRNTPDADKTIRDQRSSVDSPAVSDAPAKAKHGHGVLDHDGFVSEEDYSPPPEIPADKEARIRALYYKLPRAKAEEKADEILTEGMDALSAAKYLESLDGHYGDLRDIVRKYAERAVAENPGDFDALLFKIQRTIDDQEQEAGYRQLYKMNPDSVEVLYGLGDVLSYHHPEEAIVHLEKVVTLDPKHQDAMYRLSASYDSAGKLTKALTAAEKAYQIVPTRMGKGYVDSLKRRIENEQNEVTDVQEKGTEPSKPDSTAVSVPSETEAPVDESRVDESPTTEPTEQNDARKKKARQEMEAEFEQLLTDLERMVTGESDLSDAVKGEVADLERESKPKLSPNDDPDDERARRKSEASEKRRRRSTERSEDDEDGDDARADEDASEEDEER